MLKLFKVSLFKGTRSINNSINEVSNNQRRYNSARGTFPSRSSWIKLMSTSSSNPSSSSVTLFAIHGLITSIFTFVISTYPAKITMQTINKVLLDMLKGNRCAEKTNQMFEFRRKLLRFEQLCLLVWESSVLLSRRTLFKRQNPDSNQLAVINKQFQAIHAQNNTNENRYNQEFTF